MRIGGLVVGMIIAVGACVQPITRPMRTEPGGRATLALGAAVGGEDEVFCHDDCDQRDVWTPAMTADVGYGWMIDRGVGASAGLRLGAPKTSGKAALSVAWAQVTAQTNHLAVAASAEAGPNMIGGLVGAEVRPFEADGLTLTGYVRYAHALHGPADPSEASSLERSSWDTGVNLRIAGWVFQYAYDRRIEGRFAVPVFIEGSAEANSWHVLLIGRDLTFTIGG